MLIIELLDVGINKFNKLSLLQLWNLLHNQCNYSVCALFIKCQKLHYEELQKVHIRSQSNIRVFALAFGEVLLNRV